MSRAPVRSRLVALLLALGVPAVALTPTLAEGQAPPKASSADGGGARGAAAAAGEPTTSDRYDPENITAISQFMETLVKGNEKFKAKEFTQAVDLYKKAIQLNPKNALGHYVLAEAQSVTGNLGEAEAEILEAQQYTDARNPQLRALVLFSTADIYEREKKWDLARTAWQAYSDYATKFGGDGGMFPLSANERLKQLDKVLAMEKAYVGVRERIAADKAARADAGPKKK